MSEPITKSEQIQPTNKKFSFRGHVFTTEKEIGAFTLIDIGKMQESMENDPTGQNSGELTMAYTMHKIVMSLLIQEDRQRFENFCRNASPLVGVEEYGDILQSLLELVAGNPTQPSSDSAPSLPVTGDTSTVSMHHQDKVDLAL